MSTWINPMEKHCLRCGHKWWTRYQYFSKPTKPKEPKRCAKCRTPLWNVPKTHTSGPKSALELARDAEEARAADLAAKPKGKTVATLAQIVKEHRTSHGRRRA